MQTILRTACSLLGIAILGACSKHNPASCCTTQAQCQMFGLDHLYGCSGDQVCSSAGSCEEPECQTGSDCPTTAPFCANRLCTGACSNDNDCASVPGKPHCASTGACVAGPADAGIDSADAPAMCVPELVFERGDLFDFQVFTVDLMSFTEHQVSNGTDKDADPAWSPDGKRIALVRNNSSLVLVDADGSNPHVADVESGLLAQPAWSPDGQRVAYTLFPPSNGTPRVFSASVTGSVGTNLTPASEAEGPVEYSPDGARIVYVSNQTGNYDVFTMNANGTGQTNLTNRSGNDGQSGAHWSPDGSKIVFGGGNHVWVMNANGSGLANLTGTTSIEDQPAWSSDGSKIYYVVNPTSGGQLFVMNANGANQHAIENNPAVDVNPVTSPDGTMIAWVSYRDGNAEIYVASADGSNPTRVTNNPAKDLAPRWRPCPP